jgi:hypothetical protein
MTFLRETFDRCGCDKGSRHGYERVYEPFFEPIRNEPFRILEIGILRGESLKAWTEYFPNARIVGLDTFERVPEKDIPILEHPRVSWLKHDSTKPLDLGHFDVVIDDGLHEFAAQRKTFENFFPQCGTYFIEDVWPLDQMNRKQLGHPWIYGKGTYSREEYCRLMDAIEPYNVKFHDLREGRQPDSFIYQIT